MLHAQLQPKSNLVKKWLPLTADSVKIDSKSLVPGTVTVLGYSAQYYSIDDFNAVLRWRAGPRPDSIYITYRHLPYNLTARQYRYDYDSVRFYFLQEPYTAKINGRADNPIFDFGGIKTEGSIGRAIGFGNSQDAVVNSTMNLQLSGIIGDSIELTAAVSDNNIPIQPDGNTQNLREFDRILMQVKKNNWQLNLGDIDLRESDYYFLRFYKRLQGISFLTDNKIGRNIQNSFLVSGALAKGKFTRNILIPLDGNQGPYKLQGANNELYFVVLPNTERVFIDGVLQQRGEDQDYVINYNTAEISFTPKRLITKDLRIQIEFEYADRNYLNSQLYATDDLQVGKKARLYFGIYSNTDAKNSSIDQVLSVDQKQFLSGVGDSIGTAFFQNAVLDTFIAGKILYKKIDTVYNLIVHDSIYVQSANPNDVLYNLSFTYLGPGRGNYRELLNATNGKVFEWVSPNANNEPQGDWEPVSLLITPKQLQVFTLGGKYQLSKHSSVQAEIGASNYDVNLFSSADKKNDKGFATRIIMADESRAVSKKYLLNSVMTYEYVEQSFRPLERLRTIEFYRDWGLPLTSLQAKEYLGNISAKLYDSVGNFLQLATQRYQRFGSYAGNKQIINGVKTYKGYRIYNDHSFTRFDGDVFDGFFYKNYIEVKKTLSSLRQSELALAYRNENNRSNISNTDSLQFASFRFYTFESSIKTNPSLKNKFGISHLYRKNLAPFKNAMMVSDYSNNYNVFADFLKNENSQLRLNTTYRNLQAVNPIIPNLKSDKTLLGRVEYSANALKGLLNAFTLYEIGSGQEQKREFSYLQVPAGQGQYTWIDYNQNGVPELNEFEEAIFQDQKKYIRIYTPGQQYIKANYLQFNYNITLEPRNMYETKPTASFKKVLYNTTVISSWQRSKKVLAGDGFLFNPFARTLQDTTLLTQISYLSNSLFYNRTSTTWGLDFTQSGNVNKALLNYGFESRRLNRYTSKLRINVTKNIVANITARYIKNALNTNAVKFNNRNYKVINHEVEPAITYVYKSKLKASLAYALSNKQNRIDSMEKALEHRIETDVKYNAFKSGSLQLKFAYNQIDFRAYRNAENTTVGFILLNGLVPGRNLLWNAEFIKTIGSNLELTISYNGRKPGVLRSIHTGNASIRLNL